MAYVTKAEIEFANECLMKENDFLREKIYFLEEKIKILQSCGNGTIIQTLCMT